MLRRILAALLAPALGVLLALGATPPAQAALPPGDPAQWSVETELPYLPSCASLSGSFAGTSVGGWSQRSFFASTSATQSPPWQPITVRMGEPCIGSTGLLRVPVGQSSSVIEPADGVDWAAPVVRLVGIQCVRSTGLEYLYSGAMTSVTMGNPGGTALATPLFLTMGNVETQVQNNCARVVSITAEVVFGGGSFPWSVGEVVFTTTWSAAAWLGNDSYDGEVPGGLIEWCVENPESVECEFIVPKDPGDFGDTCGTPDNADYYGVEYVSLNPVDAETWGPWVTWYALCLFVPLDSGGFDRDGRVAAAWADSPNNQAGNALVNLANTWTFAPSCGVLLSTDSASVLPSLTVDTCTWTWAEPVRTVLGIGVLALGLWWFITYCVRAISGVIRKHVPSPVEGDGSDG